MTARELAVVLGIVCGGFALAWYAIRGTEFERALRRARRERLRRLRHR